MKISKIHTSRPPGSTGLSRPTRSHRQSRSQTKPHTRRKTSASARKSSDNEPVLARSALAADDWLQHFERQQEKNGPKRLQRESLATGLLASSLTCFGGNGGNGGLFRGFGGDGGGDSSGFNPVSEIAAASDEEE